MILAHHETAPLPSCNEALQPRTEVLLQQQHGHHSLAEGGVVCPFRPGARWEGGGSLSSPGPGLHYFHVADWGMERGGIMSRRYSRWRSTAEDVL